MCHALLPFILQVRTQTSSSWLTFLLNTDRPSCMLGNWEHNQSRASEQNSCPDLFKVGGEMGSFLAQSALFRSHEVTQNKHVWGALAPQAGVSRGRLSQYNRSTGLRPSCELAACQPQHLHTDYTPTLAPAYPSHATCICLVTLRLRQARNQVPGRTPDRTKLPGRHQPSK